MAARATSKPRLSAVRTRAKPPAPPKDLQATGTATWRLCWTLPQIFYPGDMLMVGRLCRLEDEAAALRAQMLQSGPTLTRPVQNSKGEVIGSEMCAHPAPNPLRRIGLEVAEICTELGLSPSSRHNLGLEVEARSPDGVDRLRERRRKRRAAAGIV